MTIQLKLASFLSVRGEVNTSSLSSNKALQASFQTLSYAEMDQFLTAVREARFGRLKGVPDIKRKEKKTITASDKNRLKVILSRHKLLKKYATRACQDTGFVELCYVTPLCASIDFIQQAARLASFNLLSVEVIAALQKSEVITALQAIPSFKTLTKEALKAQVKEAIQTDMKQAIPHPVYKTMSTAPTMFKLNPLYVPYNPKRSSLGEPTYTEMRAAIYENTKSVMSSDDILYDTVKGAVPKPYDVVVERTSSGYDYFEMPHYMNGRAIISSQTEQYAKLKQSAPVYQNAMHVNDKKSKAYDRIQIQSKTQHVYARLDNAPPVYQNVIHAHAQRSAVYDKAEPIYTRLEKEEAIYENLVQAQSRQSKVYDRLARPVILKANPLDHVMITVPQFKISDEREQERGYENVHNVPKRVASSDSPSYMAMQLSINKALLKHIEAKIGKKSYIDMIIVQLLGAVSDQSSLERIQLNTFNQATMDWPEGLLDAVMKLLKKGIHTESLVSDLIETPSLFEWVNKVPLSELDMKVFVLQHASCFMALRKEQSEKVSCYQHKIDSIKGEPRLQTLAPSYQNELLDKAKEHKGKVPKGMIPALRKLAKRKIHIKGVVKNRFKKSNIVDWINEEADTFRPLKKSRLKHQLFKPRIKRSYTPI